MFSAAFLSTLLHRVKAVLRRAVQEGVRPEVPAAADASVPDSIAPALRGRTQVWLRAKLRALTAVMRRIEAGERFEQPIVSSRSAAEVPRGGLKIPHEERMPRGFGWMCGLGPNVRRDGAAFAAWLHAPAMRAMVLAAPVEMARAISPILAAVGERRPVWFPVARRGNNTRPLGERNDHIGFDTDDTSSPSSGSGPGMTRRSQPRVDGSDVAVRRRVKRGDRKAFRGLATIQTLASSTIPKKRCLDNTSSLDVLVATT